MANFMPEYSVWYPATSSVSASGRSNGGRLVSASAAMHVQQERRELDEDVPLRQPPQARRRRSAGACTATMPVHRERPAVQHHGDQRQAHAHLVGDHLRARADRTRAAGSSNRSTTPPAPRRRRRATPSPGSTGPDVQVRDLERHVVAEQRHARAERDHRERQQRGDHRGAAAPAGTRAGRPSTGVMPSLKNSFSAVGQRDAAAPNGPARFGPIRVCMSAMTLRSIQIDEHHGRAAARRRSRPRGRRAGPIPTASTRARHHAAPPRGLRRPRRRRLGRRSSVTAVGRRAPRAACWPRGPGWFHGTNTAPAATPSVMRTGNVASPARVAQPGGARRRTGPAARRPPGCTSTNAGSPSASFSSRRPPSWRPSSTSSG